MFNLSTSLGYSSDGNNSGVLHGISYMGNTITFNSNGTFTASLYGYSSSMSVYNVDPIGPATNTPVTVIDNKGDEEESESLSGTWSINGSELSISGGDIFYLSSDGNTFIAGYRDTSSYPGNGTANDVSLNIGVRLVDTDE